MKTQRKKPVGTEASSDECLKKRNLLKNKAFSVLYVVTI